MVAMAGDASAFHAVHGKYRVTEPGGLVKPQVKRLNAFGGKF
jgi:hypothetical protein